MLAVLIAIPAAVVAVSSVLCRRFVKRGGSAKKATLAHIAAALVAGILVCSLALAVSAEGDAPAAEAAADAAPVGGFAAGMAYIAAALVTGLSGIGGGIAVAAGAPAAIGATSEDPKAFGKALIFVALGEGIALYGLLVSILILSKV
ncbi:MAG: hypothetical protein IKG80_06485 [Clostridia bacterium]|nr:hypothetical protein [Clostridia bacterium]